MRLAGPAKFGLEVRLGRAERWAGASLEGWVWLRGGFGLEVPLGRLVWLGGAPWRAGLGLAVRLEGPGLA